MEITEEQLESLTSDFMTADVRLLIANEVRKTPTLPSEEVNVKMLELLRDVFQPKSGHCMVYAHFHGNCNICTVGKREGHSCYARIVVRDYTRLLNRE